MIQNTRLNQWEITCIKQTKYTQSFETGLAAQSPDVPLKCTIKNVALSYISDFYVLTFYLAAAMLMLVKNVFKS